MSEFQTKLMATVAGKKLPVYGGSGTESKIYVVKLGGEPQAVFIGELEEITPENIEKIHWDK